VPAATDRAAKGTPRAAALPPDERRAAIVAAALPLVYERGAGVTTKQIADAAGIAEGTIFRVFPDKGALLEAVLESAFDTSRVEAAIAAIDRALPFPRQLEAAVEIMQRRMSVLWRLFSAMAESVDAVQPKAAPPSGDLDALTELFEPERPNLRHEPLQAARALRALTMASSHPALHPDEPMSPAEIVSLLLDGIRTQPQGAPC
jgi:AcrR family transcriptional regulator